jgi:tetratricopeptide (TPR) repeat protein
LLFELGPARLKFSLMLPLPVMARFAGLLALALCLSGCIPGDSHVDEEKDPHFQRGINLVNSQDFTGAVEEFEKALETNPRSAAAHFQLGWLYDNKVNDSAAAIYHYQRHLQWMPNSDRAQSVRQRIRLCKQELANTEFPLPGSQHLQREADRLTAENAALRQQLAALQHQAAATANLAQAGAQPARSTAHASSAVQLPASSHPRVHIVKERETISSIAAQYGLKTSAILAANPRVDPRRLRIGQSLNLP